MDDLRKHGTPFAKAKSRNISKTEMMLRDILLRDPSGMVRLLPFHDPFREYDGLQSTSCMHFFLFFK